MLELNDHLLIEKVMEEMVVLDPISGEYYTLNEAAARMLELYKDNPDQEAVVKQICSEFEVSEEQAATDFSMLMQTLIKYGLVKE